MDTGYFIEFLPDAMTAQPNHFSESPLRIRYNRLSTAGGAWHYHPELELHYVVKGSGMKFIGHHIANFYEGDIVLIGENLPHCWRGNEGFDEGFDPNVETIALHFSADGLGPEFLRLPEAYNVQRLFARARNGIAVNGKTRDEVAGFLKSMVCAGDLERIILFLKILKALSESGDNKLINSNSLVFHKQNRFDLSRLNKICSYTLSNFRKKIHLSEIASTVNLSIASFCRYFKAMTGKNYLNFVNEFRVSYACRRLIENRWSTEMILVESGFNNTANFYRNFRRVTGFTPAEYRRKYLTAKDVVNWRRRRPEVLGVAAFIDSGH